MHQTFQALTVSSSSSSMSQLKSSSCQSIWYPWYPWFNCHSLKIIIIKNINTNLQQTRQNFNVQTPNPQIKRFQINTTTSNNNFERYSENKLISLRKRKRRLDFFFKKNRYQAAVKEKEKEAYTSYKIAENARREKEGSKKNLKNQIPSCSERKRKRSTYII